MISTLSILGLYNDDSELFNDMYVPEGVDKDVLINNLLQEASELEVLYTDPSFMKFMIGEWSKKMKPTFDKVYEISIADYNPLYNVDAWETLTETRDLHNDTSRSGSDSEDGTNTNKVTGFNNNNFTNAEQSITDINRTNQEAINNKDYGTVTTTNRRYGNIGVTKSTELLRDAMSVTPELNIYKFIIDSFIEKFCLLIY